MKFLKNIYFFPVIISCILLLMLIVEQFNEKTAFPAEGWSRSVSVNEKSDGRTYFVSNNSDGSFEAYTPADKDILHLTLNKKLEVINKDLIPLQIHKRKGFWAEGSNVVYSENNELILYSNNVKKSIVEEVDGVSYSENAVFYWKGQNIYYLNTKTYKSTKVIKNDNPIKDILIDKVTESIVVISDLDPSALHVTYISNDKNHYIPVYSGELSLHLGARITDLTYVVRNNELHFIYTAVTRKQGVRKSKTNYLTLDLLSKEKTIEPVKIIANDNYSPLLDSNDFELFLRDGEVKLLFVSRGYLDKRTVEGNIYEAYHEGDKWFADRRSTTYQYSIKPKAVNDETIIWLDFLPQKTFSEEQYVLQAASNRDDVIQATKKLSYEDFKISIASMLTALPKSVFILFFAFLWIVPPVLVLMTLAFVNPRHIEKPSWKIRITALVLLVVSQYFVMSKINASVFVLAAPSYLTFDYSMIFYSVLLGIVSFIVMMFVRTEDWTPSVEFIYMSCINAWFMSLLLGSYLL